MKHRATDWRRASCKRPLSLAGCPAGAPVPRGGVPCPKLKPVYQASIKARLLCRLGAALLLLRLSAEFSTALAQGSLTPPGAPAPTMKSLDQIEPRTPITSVPFTIASPGSYYVTTNLTGASGLSGVTISNNNVTLDLNGFALLGVPGSLYAVALANSQTNVIVRNGTMSGWRMGVHETSGNSRNLVLDGLAIFGSATDGILLDSAATVRNCVCSSNAAIGISVTGGELTDCTAAYNVNSGIELNAGGIVRGCWSGYNGNYGIEVSSGIVSGCWAQNNAWSGIQVPGQGSAVIGNTCLDNNTSASASYAGIQLESSGNRIEGNTVSGSGHAGISVDTLYTGNIIIKNSVSGNGANNYSFNSSQVVGPLITNTVSGIITNLNPWANLSF